MAARRPDNNHVAASTKTAARKTKYGNKLQIPYYSGGSTEKRAWLTISVFFSSRALPSSVSVLDRLVSEMHFCNGRLQLTAYL